MSDFQNVTVAPILLDYANAFIPDVRLHGGDASGRIIRVQLLDNGVPVDDSNIEVYLTYNWQLGVLIGGRVKMAAADSPDGRVWQVAVPVAACAHPGTVTLGFEVKRDNTVVCSRNFTAIVERPVVDYGSAESVLTHADLVDAANEAREQTAKVAALTQEFSQLVSKSEETTRTANAQASAAGEVAGKANNATSTANSAAQQATDAAGKVTQALQESETRLKAVEQTAADAKSVAGNANSTAEAARSTAEQATSKANDAASAASTAQQAADNATNKSKENANRIQTLDAALTASRKGSYMRAGENVQITQMTQDPLDGVTISVLGLTAVKNTAEQTHTTVEQIQSKMNAATTAIDRAQGTADAAFEATNKSEKRIDSMESDVSSLKNSCSEAQSKANSAAEAAQAAKDAVADVNGTIEKHKIETFTFDAKMKENDVSGSFDELKGLSTSRQILIYPDSDSMSIYMRTQPTFSFSTNHDVKSSYTGEYSIHVEHTSPEICSFIAILFPPNY